MPSSIPLLARPEILRLLQEKGEILERQFIGACATLSFNGFRLEVDNKAGFRDTLETPYRAALDALWSDLLARIPGMGRLAAPLSSPRFSCGFCGGDAATERLIVTSGRAAICDRCALIAEAAFAAMPASQTRREQVGYGILVPPPDEPLKRARLNHCHFGEMAPARGEPLVSQGEGCPVCDLRTSRWQHRADEVARFRSKLFEQLRRRVRACSQLLGGREAPKPMGVAEKMGAEYVT